jgi:hypothetical protein
MTPSELKYQIEQTGKEQHFFDRKTMKFWGDTMKNYGVRSTIVLAQFNEQWEYNEQGYETEVWELYRKHPVKHGMSKSAYFRKSDYSRIHSIKED